MNYQNLAGCSLSLEKNAGELLVAAEKYQLEQLKVSCEDELISKLKVGNCIEMLILGEKQKAANLKASAIDFFNKNSTKFATDDWKLAMKDHPNLLMELMECILKRKL